MNRVLRIADTVGGIVVRMPAVLVPLAPEARALHWSVLDLGEIVPGDGSDLSVPYTEQRVLETPRGWQVTFDGLTRFASSVRQVIDGVFVAAASAERLPRRTDDDAAIVQQADMLVAAIDSSFWLVSAPDEVLARVERAFGHVSEQDPSTMTLSTWGRDY